MDEDGYFTIVDRMKDMILTAGFNVYPAEIERVLCGHPAVALAAVGGIPDETKGELAKAYVVLKPGAEATREELVAHCRQHLAAYKVPRAIQFTEQSADDVVRQDHAPPARRDRRRHAVTRLGAGHGFLG